MENKIDVKCKLEQHFNVIANSLDKILNDCAPKLSAVVNTMRDRNLSIDEYSQFFYTERNSINELEFTMDEFRNSVTQFVLSIPGYERTPGTLLNLTKCTIDTFSDESILRLAEYVKNLQKMEQCNSKQQMKTQIKKIN